MVIQKVVRSFNDGSISDRKLLDKILLEGFIVKHITPFPTEDFIEYIVEKNITPNCDYVKLNEATKEQLLEELSKRLGSDE